jgi:MoaA/NifB/PqqE/SkfB family radical SAM enzyme
LQLEKDLISGHIPGFISFLDLHRANLSLSKNIKQSNGMENASWHGEVNSMSTVKPSASAFVVGALTRIVGQANLRRWLAGKLESQIHKALVEEDSQNLSSVQEKKCEFMGAMLESAIRNMDRGRISRRVVNRLIEVLVKNCLLGETGVRREHIRAFEEEYNQTPPAFIVVSPTQKCNLMCKGCYAGSTRQTAASLPYDVVDRIVGEAHDIFGSRFVTISGGEPLMYRDQGKTLMDIYRKYDDMFFLFYTNGTLITERLAEEMRDLGNVTPAISVEGFESETDQRRGKGTFRKLLEVFGYLTGHGVPFGVSVTSTAGNVDLLLTEDFYDFYFDEQGASYMWQFQLMPIGRGREALDGMVTPEKRVRLFRMWERMLKEKKYCIADFWNSGVLSDGCIAYGRGSGYFYIDWNGNIMPCVFIPYYVDNVYDLYRSGNTIADALFSDFMKNGRRWQEEYGLNHRTEPGNWLMPCSIRDHYDAFRKSIMPCDVKPENRSAAEALKSDAYYEVLKEYDQDLSQLTEGIWNREYLNGSGP